MRPSSAILRIAFVPPSPAFPVSLSSFTRGVHSLRTPVPVARVPCIGKRTCTTTAASLSISARDNGIAREDAATSEDIGFTEAKTEVLDDIGYSVDVPANGEPKDEQNGMGPQISTFRLSESTVKRLAENGITHATEVQAGTFDLVYDGKDIIAKSRTGTGKTLAFALPILERLAIIKREKDNRSARNEGPGCIVLAPTRELAKQVAREMKYVGEGLGLSVECFYGGVAYGPQEGALRRGVDVVVGTPGRIIDHLDRGMLRLDNISFAVLDEADEMLSMGFAEDVETVFETLPPVNERQVILFSATVPSWVKGLAAQYQKKDVVTFDAVTTGSMASTTVRHCAVRVPERDEARAALLADIIAVHCRTRAEDVAAKGPSRAIVFCQTKREADDLATSGNLEGCGAAVLHGDVSQAQREITLSMFRQGQFQVLVATDVAARGLDISGVDVVVQYRVPQDTGSYIHRAGRTGRAGKSGTAVVLYSDREMRSLKILERECNIKFEQEPAPGPEAAVEAAVDVALQNVPAVDERVVKHLLPRAEAMLRDDHGNLVKTLAAILAIAGRRVRIEDRSLLSGEVGMRTVVVHGEREISTRLALRFISDLGRTVEGEHRVGLIRMCKDGRAVADVSSKAAEALVEASTSLGEDAEVKLSLAMEIPTLRDDREQDRDRDRRRGGRSGYGRDRSRDRDRRGGRLDGGGRFERERGRGGYRSEREYGGYGRGGVEGYGRRRDDGYGRRRDEGYTRRRDEGYGRRGDSGRGRRSADFLSDDF